MSKPDNFITDPDIIEGFSQDVFGETMVPDYLVRPGSLEEIVDCLTYCQQDKIPVTPAGALTGYSQAGLTDKGVCLSTNKLKSIIEINEDECFVIAEPGILLGDLKAELKEKNLYYPPDPTSENIASLGGTVATNAGGTSTFKYGQTAEHVLGLEVVLPGGAVETINSCHSTKRSNGPVALSQAANLWVGSEGILGVISKVKLKVLRGIPNAFSIVGFFPTMESLVYFVLDAASGRTSGIEPRTMEFMDSSCLQLLRDSGKFPQVPEQAAGAIMCEQEFFSDLDCEAYLEAWLNTLAEAGAMVDDSIVADSPGKREELKELRHYVPSTLNERGMAARETGGRKISTDWAVPIDKLPTMLKDARKLCEDYGFPSNETFRFAHLGNGHPHFNFIPQNPEELKRCYDLRHELTKRAIALGGISSAEHGIGKVRKELLKLEGSGLRLKLLAAMKRELDPFGLMAPGNIL